MEDSSVIIHNRESLPRQLHKTDHTQLQSQPGVFPRQFRYADIKPNSSICVYPPLLHRDQSGGSPPTYHSHGSQFPLDLDIPLTQAQEKWLDQPHDEEFITPSGGEKEKSSIHMMGQLLDVWNYGDVDLVAHADTLKDLLKSPFSKKEASFAVHKVGNSFLVDKFDVNVANEQFKKRKKKKTPSSSSSSGGPPMPSSSNPSNTHLNSPNVNPTSNPHTTSPKLIPTMPHNAVPSLLLPSSSPSCSPGDLLSSPAGSLKSSPAPTLQLMTGLDSLSLSTERLEDEIHLKESSEASLNLSDPVFSQTKDSSSSSTSNALTTSSSIKNGFSPSSFQHHKHLWSFQDMRALVSSNMAIFGDSSHPAVSIRVCDEGVPINVLTGMDMWLDNLMCNVPEILMCYHLNGVVKQYETLKTEDLPDRCNFKAEHIKDIAEDILSFLNTNCTKEGHTYWLYKGTDDDVVRLYDLTTLCDSSTADDNPFSYPVAMLLLRIATNMHRSLHPDKSTIRRLLFSALHLINKAAHPEIVAMAVYILTEIATFDQPSDEGSNARPSSPIIMEEFDEAFKPSSTSSDTFHKLTTEETFLFQVRGFTDSLAQVSQGVFWLLDTMGPISDVSMKWIAAIVFRGASLYYEIAKLYLRKSWSNSIQDDFLIAFKSIILAFECTNVTSTNSNPQLLFESHDGSFSSLVPLSYPESSSYLDFLKDGDTMASLLELLGDLFYKYALYLRDHDQLVLTPESAPFKLSVADKALVGSSWFLSSQISIGEGEPLETLWRRVDGLWRDKLLAVHDLTKGPKAVSFPFVLEKMDFPLQLAPNVLSNLILSSRAYEKASKVKTSSRLENSRAALLKKLGNSLNMAGTLKMEYLIAIDPSSSHEASAQFKETWADCHSCFSAGVECFSLARDHVNVSLLNCNLAKLMRIGYRGILMEGKASATITKQERDLHDKAIFYYRIAIAELEKTPNLSKSSLWVSMNADLAGAYLAFAALLQDSGLSVEPTPDELQRISDLLHHALHIFDNSLMSSDDNIFFGQSAQVRQRLSKLAFKEALLSTDPKAMEKFLKQATAQANKAETSFQKMLDLSSALSCLSGTLEGYLHLGLRKSFTPAFRHGWDYFNAHYPLLYPLFGNSNESRELQDNLERIFKLLQTLLKNLAALPLTSPQGKPETTFSVLHSRLLADAASGIKKGTLLFKLCK